MLDSKSTTSTNDDNNDSHRDKDTREDDNLIYQNSEYKTKADKKETPKVKKSGRPTKKPDYL